MVAILLSVGLSFPAVASGIDEFINNQFAPVAEVVSTVVYCSVPLFVAELPLVGLWLIVVGIFLPVFFTF
jgi:AGCS family alanine or glycine:cation symporter